MTSVVGFIVVGCAAVAEIVIFITVGVDVCVDDIGHSGLAQALFDIGGEVKHVMVGFFGEDEEFFIFVVV